MISAKRKRPLPAEDPKRLERESLAAKGKYCQLCNRFYDSEERHCPNCGNAKQQCSEEGCGRIFYAEAPGKCAICSGGKPQPSAAERLLPLKTCDACGEIYGAEYLACPACQKRAKAANPKSKSENRKSLVDGSAEKALVEITVDVRKIEVRGQARQTFDEAAIDALAQSIDRDGLLQPPVVRHNPGNTAQPYVLVAGERRLRAVKQLGWTSVPVRLASGAVDDAQALLLQGEENVLREQFNDVELAQWCKRATSPIAEGGGGLTQEQLAQRLSVTQAEISNRIRLLRCPRWALELVMSGQMSRKHALALLAFEGFDEILSAVEKETRQTLKRDGGLGTAEEYSSEVHRTARDKTAPIEDDDYRYELGGRVKYQIAAEDLKGLRTVSVRCWGKEEMRAVDKKAAEKLLEKAKREALAKAEAKKKGKGKQAGGGEKKLTPAEQKRRGEQLAEQHRKRVEAWFYDWLRVLCAERLKGDEPHAGRIWLARWALLEQAVKRTEACNLFFAESLRGRNDAGNREETLRKLSTMSQAEFHWAERSLALGLLIDEEDGPRTPDWQGLPVPNEVVALLASLLKLDVAAAWRDDRRSAMRQKFWELHAKEQLLELGRELKVPLLEPQKKSVMVNLLLGQDKPLPLPKSLAGLVGKLGGKKTEKRTRSRGGAK